MLSIVIPIHNEEPSILPLYDRLTSVLESLQKQYEILFVDDASTDRSFDLLANLVETDQRLKVIRLRRNFGQTAALAAGFDEAQGQIILSLDGDLQHAPEDIPALIEKIEEGYDSAGLGGSILTWLAVDKFWTGRDLIAEHGPLMLLGALALVTGVILFCTGLLGEVLTRTYFESQGRRIYAVREIRTRREPTVADG